MTEPKCECRSCANERAAQQATERAALIASRFQELEHKTSQLREQRELIKQAEETAPPTTTQENVAASITQEILKCVQRMVEFMTIEQMLYTLTTIDNLKESK